MKATSVCETTGSSGKLTGNRSIRAGIKKGADLAVGERKTGRKNAEQEKKEDTARAAFEEKERGCTVRLFGTNSLKKGAV
jgi:DNA-directed RNA polymerase beta' subunit